MRYLVDSDWLIDALSGVTGASEYLERLAVDGVAVSIITYGEVYEGAFSAPDPPARLLELRRFLAGFALLSLDDVSMVEFASLRALLRRQGQLIPDMDLLIAATAMAHDLTLATRNTRHFARLPTLRLATGGAGG